MITLSTARRMASRTLLAATMAVSATLSLLGIVSAGDVTFTMQNSHPYAVELELYSQDRDHVWPGGGQVYILDDGETKQVPLSCEDGENICYGAWVKGDQGTYWGVGPDNAQTCDNCCYTCEGGETEHIELTE